MPYEEAYKTLEQILNSSLEYRLFPLILLFLARRGNQFNSAMHGNL